MNKKEKLEVVKALQSCGIRQYRLALEEVEKDLNRLEKQDRVLELLIRAFGRKVLNDEIGDAYERNVISKNQYNLLKDWVNNKELL